VSEKAALYQLDDRLLAFLRRLQLCRVNSV
jgi:hypothetical protein